MKSRTLLMALVMGLPGLTLAQTNDDDLYFVPKKEKKVEKKEVSRPAKTQNTTVYANPGSTVVVKNVSGNTANMRDIDEYNRRYTAKDNKFSVKNDTLYIEEKPYDERGEWVNGFDGSQDDYEYAMRIVRFRSPRYAIPVSSPLYWDVVYGAFPSWNWNVYDDGFYAYVFPTYSNPLWWDWRWNWSVSGSRWGFGWGWSSPYYYSSWYGPHYYAGYWGGYDPFWRPGWGGHSHHAPYYGWAGGFHRSGYSDYRPSRYASSPNRYVSGNGGNFNRYTRPGNNVSYGRGSRGISGRVVSPSDRNGYSTVRPSGNNSSFRRGSSTAGTDATRSGTVVRGGNSGTYVRPGNVIDRSGSSYNRPSSTRRSVNYGQGNSEPSGSYSRPSNTNSGSYSHGGDFNRGSSVGSGGNGGFSRGSSVGAGSSRGGSVGSGGSSRRR